ATRGHHRDPGGPGDGAAWRPPGGAGPGPALRGRRAARGRSHRRRRQRPVGGHRRLRRADRGGGPHRRAGVLQPHRAAGRQDRRRVHQPERGALRRGVGAQAPAAHPGPRGLGRRHAPAHGQGPDRGVRPSRGAGRISGV
ncbi:MAG: Dihydroneopterin aldolase, partial [uncultured Acidimicrobiales bacterium]